MQAVTPQSFSEFFADLVEQGVLVPKEVAHVTGRSSSTVYRWLRGETAPDIDSFRLLLLRLNPEAKNKLFTWLVQDLPTHIEWVDSSSELGAGLRPAEARERARSIVLQLISDLLVLFRAFESSDRISDTLTQHELAGELEGLDEAIHQLIEVKLLQGMRIAERKRAK